MCNKNTLILHSPTCNALPSLTTNYKEEKKIMIEGSRMITLESEGMAISESVNLSISYSCWLLYTLYTLKPVGGTPISGTSFSFN